MIEAYQPDPDRLQVDHNKVGTGCRFGTEAGNWVPMPVRENTLRHRRPRRLHWRSQDSVGFPPSAKDGTRGLDVRDLCGRMCHGM